MRTHAHVLHRVTLPIRPRGLSAAAAGIAIATALVTTAPRTLPAQTASTTTAAAPVATGSITGFKGDGYALAGQALRVLLS